MQEEEVITYYIGTFKYEDYDDVGAFKEGLIWVRKDGLQFHIRPDGTPAYTERFDNRLLEMVSDFHEGLACANKDDDGWYHIRPDGTPAYTQRYGWVSHFKNGLAWASRMKKNPEGFQIVESFHIRHDGSRVD